MFTGFFFLLVGTVGVLRLPDFYTRMHAVGKCDTLGLLLCLVGLMVYEGVSLVSLKMLYIWVFILMASPTATHVFLRAALRAGLKPWTRTEGRS
ncbi:MAG: monovalent cation/H(+) antiporter subunit G [Candidatus Desulforudis sp.]|nr:monovalent cation/H(+) antiporter subunit G [Desulforudis sp.]